MTKLEVVKGIVDTCSKYDLESVFALMADLHEEINGQTLVKQRIKSL